MSGDYIRKIREGTCGYHIRDIPRGIFGEISKIEEELAELKDAAEQGVKVMVLCELSDMIGAMSEYLRVNYPGITIGDLEAMSNVTRRAFLSGARSPKD